jgi:spore germination protein GerM
MQKFRLPLWALAWLAVVLAALVLFLANQGAVDRLLAATGLEKVLYPQGKNPPTVVTAPVPAPVPTVLVEPAQPAALPLPSPPVPAPPATAAGQPAAAPEAAPDATDVPLVVEPPLPNTPNTYRLYFLRLSPEGRMEPAGFVRELPAGATPLTATIKALLQGPTLQDKAQGALTLIPEGTKLLSVRLKDRTALLSFSEEFDHNPSGLEGIAGQLRQIVWTATQFGSVDSVQFLVNGQYRDTLGDGGLSVAVPLTRSSVP